MQITVPKNVGNRRERHWCAGMSAVSLLYRVHGQSADGVYAKLSESFGGISVAAGALSSGFSLALDFRAGFHIRVHDGLFRSRHFLTLLREADSVAYQLA